MKFFLQHNLLKLRGPLYYGTLILLLNLLSRDFFFRIDLTQDKRYSLSEYTKNFLSELKEEITIKVYLEGDLPIEYKKYKNSVRDFLSIISNKNENIRYKFIDVNKLPKNKRLSFFKKLKKRKMYAKNVFIFERGKKIEKILFPYAQVSFRGKTLIFKLLKNYTGSQALQIKQSTEEIEYTFMRAIKCLFPKSTKKIGIIEGIGEPNKIYLQGLINLIKENFSFEFINLSTLESMINFDAVILVGPTKKINEKQKYILDQYIMRGGKVLFFVNSLKISFKRLIKGLDFALPNDISLSDILFNYGVRVNVDLIQDLHSTHYPVVIGNENKKPIIKWLRWPFFPIFNNYGKHIITKNLDSISTKFVSSISEVKVKDVKHTPIVFSSKFSKISRTPVQINLNDLRKEPNIKEYRFGPFPVVYLLEGKFKSFFKNRFIPEGFEKKYFIDKSKKTKLLVASSESLVMNEVNPKNNKPVALGYDFFTKHEFSQKEFILNTINFFVDENGLVGTKNKNLKLRLLNTIKTKKQFLIIQVINMFLPILILIIFGIIWNFVYRNRYNKYPK